MSSAPYLEHEGRSESALVVDDEPAVRQLITGISSSAGHRVVTACSAEEALRILECQSIALADAIVERLPGVRVLFMSGYADEAVVRSGNLGEGAAYLEKPFSGRELAHKVRETLDADGSSVWRHVA